MKLEGLLDQYVLKVLEIAKNAGKEILTVYQSDDINVIQKTDESPLTLADQKSNDCIVAGLEVLDPSIPIISEENDQISYEQRKNFDYCWIVDPLDGTKEFIKRNGEFTVNIALAHKDKIILGVVYAPVSQDLYWAIKDGGAFKEDGTEVKRKINALDFKLTDANLTVVCSRSHLNDTTQKYIDNLNEPRLIPKGSSLKMMEIAEGKAHLYPRFGPTMEWDTAASQIIVEEAGGQMIQVDIQKALTYNKENLLNPHFIAHGKKHN